MAQADPKLKIMISCFGEYVATAVVMATLSTLLRFLGS